jgi:hypothetical protein
MSFTNLVIPLPIHDSSFPESLATSSNHIVPISTESSNSSLDVFPNTLNSNSDQISTDMSFNFDLVAFVMQIFFLETYISLILELNRVYFLDIHMALKGTNFMI